MLSDLASACIFVYLSIAFLLYYLFFNRYIEGKEEIAHKEIITTGFVVWFWPIWTTIMIMVFIWFCIYWPIKIGLCIIEELIEDDIFMKCLNGIRFRLRRWFSRKKVKMLCIGMQRSKFAGDAPDCNLGVARFFKASKARCNYAKALYSEEATKDTVIKELQKICDSDLAIFVYNGHGGKEPGKLFETDGTDEFLALYDKPLFDNEIWNILSNAKGRVFLILDCCYAGGMVRERESNLVLPKLTSRDNEHKMDILCWASSSESNVSYIAVGSGGIFMRTLSRYVDAGLTYDQIWKKIIDNDLLAKSEIAHVMYMCDGKSEFRKAKFLS